VLNGLLLMALIFPVVLLTVALIAERWVEIRLRFPQRRPKPDDEQE
jgi:hypothetical protein